jgi:cell shape-determining protein MreC
MPVVAAAGLYGQVQTIDKHSCQVLLISSPQFRITGKVSRDPPPIGFIQGQSTGAMVFDVVDAKVLPQNGDKVFTSGLSERIPEGILIGTIVQKEEDIAYGSERCQVYPAVTIGAVREVFVLK